MLVGRVVPDVVLIIVRASSDFQAPETLLGLLYPADEGTMIPQNVGKLLRQ
jgi:hypothetical protein